MAVWGGLTNSCARVQERSKGDTTCLTTSQNPSLWHPSWLNKVCTTRKGSESEWLAKANPETNLITINPKTVSHVAELFSWVSLPYCSPPGCPFPIKSLVLSHVCLFRQFIVSVRQEPSFGPWKGSPFLQHFCDPNYYTVHGILQARILERVAYLPLLQWIFLTQESYPDLLHRRQILYNWSIRKALQYLLTCLLFSYWFDLCGS